MGRVSAKKSETRPSPTLRWEARLGHPHQALMGIDEVGRGCLAGPVVAGAVILPSEIDFRRDSWLKEIADSKCLTAEKREELAPLIESWAASFGIGVATVEEIDSINIYHASHLAMERAAQAALERAALVALERAALAATGRAGALLAPEIHAIVDGKFLPKSLPCPATAVIQGDLHCLSVAAASILAKVWRDRQMKELDRAYPGYGFATHKGYGTPAHQAALAERGVCAIHRRSFAPIAARLVQAESADERVQAAFRLADRS